MQRITVNCSMSKCKPAKSGIPQGSILRQLWFNIFINDIDNRFRCTPSKCAGYTKPSSEVDELEGKDLIQKNLNKLAQTS